MAQEHILMADQDNMAANDHNTTHTDLPTGEADALAAASGSGGACSASEDHAAPPTGHTAQARDVESEYWTGKGCFSFLLFEPPLPPSADSRTEQQPIAASDQNAASHGNPTTEGSADSDSETAWERYQQYYDEFLNNVNHDAWSEHWEPQHANSNEAHDRQDAGGLVQEVADKINRDPKAATSTR